MTETRPGIVLLNRLPSPKAQEVAIGLIALSPVFLAVGFGLVGHASHAEVLTGQALNWIGAGSFLTGALQLASELPSPDATNTENTLQP